jgi:hypothetical protein
VIIKVDFFAYLGVTVIPFRLEPVMLLIFLYIFIYEYFILV